MTRYGVVVVVVLVRTISTPPLALKPYKCRYDIDIPFGVILNDASRGVENQTPLAFWNTATGVRLIVDDKLDRI